MLLKRGTVRRIEAPTSVCNLDLLLMFWGGYQTATRFNILDFVNPFSYYYQPNYLTNSSLLTLITLNSAFKDISLIDSDVYN